MFHNRKGFTLIEMLVVIAIIAVLVAVIVPTVTKSTAKAKAAADAANIRSVQGAMNSRLLGEDASDIVVSMDAPACKTFPGAEIYLICEDDGFVDVYYVKGTSYYGIKYLSHIATKGEPDPAISVAKPTTSGDWYKVGTSGVVSPPS